MRDGSLSGIFDNLFNSGSGVLHEAGHVATSSGGGGLFTGINSGLSTAAGILQTYWAGQEAVNRAQAAAQAAKYGAATQQAAQGSADLSTLTVPLLGVGAMIAISLALHNSTSSGKK